jgi:hypothetical protein
MRLAQQANGKRASESDPMLIAVVCAARRNALRSAAMTPVSRSTAERTERGRAARAATPRSSHERARRQSDHRPRLIFTTDMPLALINVVGSIAYALVPYSFAAGAASTPRRCGAQRLLPGPTTIMPAGA